jgi:hypothetical protein
MNERKLRRLLAHIVRYAAPLPVLATWSACGGSTMPDHEPLSGSGGATTPAAGSTSSTGGAGTAGMPFVTGGTQNSGGASGNGASGGADSAECRKWPPLRCTLASYTVIVPSFCVDADLSTEECKSICGITSGIMEACSIARDAGEYVTINCPRNCVEGRRPLGFVEQAPVRQGLGAHFARAAELEAASVFAFRQLRAQLHSRGAPRALLRKLSRAARDERRHTRATRALVRHFGGCLHSPKIAPHESPSLEELALDNAVEGCVRETYGALVATWQAREASDPLVRAAMLRIAREETGHAALSHELQRWLERRLSKEQLQRVRAVKRRAVADLRAALESPHETEVAQVAGLPSTARSRQLFESLRTTVWR